MEIMLFRLKNCRIPPFAAFHSGIAKFWGHDPPRLFPALHENGFNQFYGDNRGCTGRLGGLSLGQRLSALPKFKSPLPGLNKL